MNIVLWNIIVGDMLKKCNVQKEICILGLYNEKLLKSMSKHMHMEYNGVRKVDKVHGHGCIILLK